MEYCEFAAKQFYVCVVSFVISQRSPRILEQIHILARSFEDGVCSKLANIEKEATTFEAFRSQEEKKEKKYWVSKVYKDRLEKGEFHILVRDLRLHDHECFFSYFRMSPSTLEVLLSFVATIIEKSTVM